MHSLYNVLIAQHSKQLIPVACAKSTVNQLHRYFEDVVLENKLNALIIERLPGVANRTAKEIDRLKSLDQVSRGMFLLLRPRDGAATAIRKDRNNLKTIVWESTDNDVCERFVIIADSQFSALLMSIRIESGNEDGLDETVAWSFDPDIVYSALEYLMARVHAEYPSQFPAFSDVVKHSMPQETSLHLTLRITTKLVQLLQAQSRRETAVNHIATAIKSGAKIESVLATAAAELGGALAATCCAVRIESGVFEQPFTQYHFGPDAPLDASTRAELQTDLNSSSLRLANSSEPEVIDGEEVKGNVKPAQVAAPIVFNGIFMGVVLVRNDGSHSWTEDQLLLIKTVAAQVAVAANQARMAEEMQQQALTDALTGCYNRRCFELQLERDLHLATRMRQPLSLVMMDIDNFKSVNEIAGREAGDRALRMLAESLRVELRAVDTAARFADDEFAIILPQASNEGARVVAERLRRGIEQTDIPGFGRITASFGVASFPLNASSRETLVVAVDRALHHSKTSGRNLVSAPPDDYEEERIDEIPDGRHLLDLHKA